MSDMGLTHSQRDLLDFITSSIGEFGVGPSFEEMMAAMELASKSGIHRILVALEERGHIHRIKRRARAIALGPAPNQNIYKCPHCGEALRLGGDA